MVTTHVTQETSKTTSWPLHCDREQLRATLRRASKRATNQHQSILASFIQPVGWFDSLRIFTGSQSSQMDERFYWERPDKQDALVGLGVVFKIETSGPTRYTTASQIWQDLLQSAIIDYAPGVSTDQPGGPLLCGGFAFDESSQHTDLWEGFSAGSLRLPRFLFGQAGQSSTLTINQLVEETDDVEELLEDICSSLHRLKSAVEDSGSQPDLQTSGILYHHPNQSLQSRQEWMNLVERNVQQIQQGAYKKVVLARAIQVETGNADEAFLAEDVLARLRELYPGAYVFAIQRGSRYFVGATPERLVKAQQGHISTMALAGTAPRGSSEEEDQQIGQELLQSMKNAGEHRIVVDMIKQAMIRFCTQLQVANTPHLLKLKNVQHLATDISGELRNGHSILEIVATLHPTPAVGGVPRRAALQAIRSGERLDRGWYAAPVGWLDARGNGEFAVALRSGLLNHDLATLFAGCGIVGDSEPASEYIESCLKLQVMLRGLGGED
ncbi:MAG TPA: isochorismate synthase [Ktedonobacteraceae bacterium]|nr:isochorismate synthase [Ktedonobacteraceae bacterium]